MFLLFVILIISVFLNTVVIFYFIFLLATDYLFFLKFAKFLLLIISISAAVKCYLINWLSIFTFHVFLCEWNYKDSKNILIHDFIGSKWANVDAFFASTRLQLRKSSRNVMPFPCVAKEISGWPHSFYVWSTTCYKAIFSWGMALFW